MDFDKVKKIYMIGIKGVGMTMLAQFLAANGKEVSGSDIAEKFMTDAALKKSKIKVIEKFDEKNIPADADLIIYSSAYNKENNPEVAKALAGKKKALSYAEAMGQVFNQKYGVAVAGSHGKTTTTAWLGYVLEKAGVKPNVMVGANVPQFGGFSLTGQSDILIIEADEYQNKLKYFQPKAVLLNNIDYDHPDFFPTEADYENVFIEFVKKIPKKGFLVANFDDPAISKVANVNCKGRVIGYAVDLEPSQSLASVRGDCDATKSPQPLGMAVIPPTPLAKGGDVALPPFARGARGDQANAKGGDADYIAYDIKANNGKQYFKVKMGMDEITSQSPASVGGDCDATKRGFLPSFSSGCEALASREAAKAAEPGLKAGRIPAVAEKNAQELGDFSIQLSGCHNISNALAVIAAAIELGAELKDIRKYLEEFSGTARRMQKLGEYNGALIYDDYAHHPTEIKATLAGAREFFPKKNLIVVFHPHTFSRTKALLNDFAASFGNAGEVIVLDIYGSAREMHGGAHSRDLVQKIGIRNQELGIRQSVKYIAALNECEKYLRENIGKGDVIILMGAGDVFRIGERLVK